MPDFHQEQNTMNHQQLVFIRSAYGGQVYELRTITSKQKKGDFKRRMNNAAKQAKRTRGKKQ